MGGKQLLDPRWHWLRASLQKLYAELDDDSVPAVLTVIAANGEELISYSMGPDTGNEIDRRIITSPTILTAVAEATTVDANVDVSVPDE